MNTSASSKVHPRHLRRTAWLYVRQSSLRQVVENTESTRRQYDLRQRALALGWPDDGIVVVDSDLGESGASTAGREGFQRLVTEVGMGRAGIVMGLEVSRLARNSADWHRLLEICALTDTLILDEDGVYDPAHFNDRLLLGLKGTMSEAELHVIRARLRGGILNKARRGEFCAPLPIGFVYDDDDRVILDPDRQVQDAVRHLFETFRRVESGYGTVRAFREQGLLFPRRHRGGPLAGEITFDLLSQPVVIRILHNPRYAGTYTFGRTRNRKRVDGSTIVERLPPEEWTANIPGAHPGYITVEEFEENVRVLRDNDVRGNTQGMRRSIPREGTALLQGLALCGRCGQRLSVLYHTRGGVRIPTYVCQRRKTLLGEPTCHSLAGQVLDSAVSKLVTDVVTPAAIAAALDVQREILEQIDDADRLRRKAVERAQYEVDLARRRYMRVDPDNRLVADSLEAHWNDKLRALAQAREEYERQREQDRLSIDGQARERILALATDFPRLWSHPDTPNRERKRMLALIVEDVTVHKGSDTITAHVRFRGGRSETLEIPRPKNGWQAVTTASEVIAVIDRLLGDHTYVEIAEILNTRGFRPGGADRFGTERFTPQIVARLTIDYRLESRYDRLRKRGFLTRIEIMQRLGISKSCLRYWAANGLVVEHALDRRAFLYEDPGPNPPTKARGKKLIYRGQQQRKLRESSKVDSDRAHEVQYGT
jgi:DNA invertase Pin-like site-specific DNA recombinase